MIARGLAGNASGALGPVVVDDRPGAGGNLGADLVAKCEPVAKGSGARAV